MKKTVTEALSGLDAVPWSNLRHAFGPAIDIPELIRALPSPDGSVRDKTWHTLYGNLWHQGTIYEATTYAIPFLIRLLEVQAVPDKQRILIYLAMLFTGRSYWSVHKSVSILKDEISKPGFDERLKAELEWVAATKAAVNAGRDIYVQQLHEVAIEPKIAAAYLLGLIGEGDDEDERELSILEEIAKSCEP